MSTATIRWRALAGRALLATLAACTDATSEPPESARSAPHAARLALDILAAGGERRATDFRAAQFGTETRAAALVRPGERAVGRGLSPADGARLALAFGVAGTGEARRSTCALVVRIRSGAAGAKQELAAARLDRWTDAAIELGVARGEAFEIELALEDTESTATLVLGEPVVYAPSDAPPTVVLVTSDTHRGDHVEGAERAVEIRTPALRELAARGVFFSNAYAATNVTVPSHVAMLTGLHPRDSGVTDNKTPVADEADTLAEAFQAAGYRTLAVTSLNLLSPPHANIGQGFDAVAWTSETRSSGKSVDLALRHLDQAPDRPVFLWLHVFDAHGPYQPPAPFDRAFYPSKKDPADPAIEIEPGARIPHHLRGVRDVGFIRALYRGEIAYEDSELARVFDHPRVASGVVAFTADHGEVLGNHGIWWSHRNVYPDTLHVPLILAWPGAAGGTRSDAPVSNVDVGRTLLDLAGLASAPFPGLNLADAVAGPPAGTPRFGLSGGRWQAAVELDGWHLVMQLAAQPGDEDDVARELHQVELFHLPSDPACSRDLVRVEAERARSLRAKLVEWLAGWRGERLAKRKIEDAATLQDLAELGYASDEGGRDASGPLFDPKCACAWCARFR